MLRWRTVLLLCLARLLQWDVCDGQRVVQIQEGPLYRAEGYAVSIFCNVSGFHGPAEQTFEFSIYKPANPSTGIQIISTVPGFSYAVYSERVQSKDIHIERLTGSAVLLHIDRLLESDAGEYECHTPNTDGTYFGSYNAKTTVHVIRDTLRASANPAALSKTEGESLQLECEVSRQTFQHTHLSVTWFLLPGDSERRPVVTLSRDFTLRAGGRFEERYLAGSVRMEKVQDSTYRLSLASLQLSDQGQLLCQASEWIQDPDRSWSRIAYTDSEAFSLQVQPADAASDAFYARIATPEGALSEGGVLEVGCRVEAQSLLDRFFSVAWLKDGQELGGVGPTGVATVAPGYARRESAGEVRVQKKSHAEFLLAVRPVRAEDAGTYVCRVWREERAAGSFSRGESQDSAAEQVAVAVNKRRLVIATPRAALKVNEGAVLRITCNVSSRSGLLSLSWQHRQGQGAFSDVISLRHDGVVEPGAQYRQRVAGGDVRALRTTAESFTLEIANVLPSDRGSYRCTLSEGGPRAAGGGAVDQTSQEVNAEVLSLDSLISIQLISRTVVVTENEEIRLFCKVKGPRVPVSLTWSFRPSAAAPPEQIVSLLHTGAITWRNSRPSYQIWTQVQRDEVGFVLVVLRASSREEGQYQCVLNASLGQTRNLSKSSNVLAVHVRKPVSVLSVAAGPSSPLQHLAGLDVRMECAILAATSNESHFAVSWAFLPTGAGQNRTLLSMDRDSVLEAWAGERFSLGRRMPRVYELFLRQAAPRDSGRYYCRVEEWLQDPHGDWAPLASASAAIQLLISHPVSQFSVTKGDSEVTVREGDQVNLNCSLAPGSATPNSRYAVTWFFAPGSSSERAMLMRFSRDALLDYSAASVELRSRMSFSRPSVGSFGLRILSLDAPDSGSYSCRVDEYQLDSTGQWVQRAADQSGVTRVRVRQTESKLHVLKDNSSVAMGNQQGGFVIACNITSYSSDASAFEVTWWRGQANGEGEPHPIFRARRDFTLELLDQSREPLLFGRPRAALYTLTVPEARPSDRGLYYCHVEEWLLSPRNSWRKIAEDTSGYLHVSVKTQGDDSKQEAPSAFGVVPAVLLLLVVLLVVAVGAMFYKLRRSGNRSVKRKSDDSFWESHSLKPKPEL